MAALREGGSRVQLLERLAKAEMSAQQQVEDLRTRLAEAEEQVWRLSITREALMTFANDEHAESDAA